MTITNATLRRPKLRRLFQALVVLCAIVFALQLIASAAHKHEAGEKVHDCVSCHFSSHFPADLPSTPPALLAVFLALAYVLARQAQYLFFAVPSYLIPPRQAPPAVSPPCSSLSHP